MVGCYHDRCRCNTLHHPLEVGDEGDEALLWLAAGRTHGKRLGDKLMGWHTRNRSYGEVGIIREERRDEKMKKWLVGTLIVAAIGVLIAGAIIRTMSTTQTSTVLSGSGRGGNSQTLTSGTPEQQASSGAPNGAGQGSGGNGGRGEPRGNGAGEGQANVEAWTTFEGVVTSVDELALTVSLDDGREMVVDRRAWVFARKQGFATEAGHVVSLVGFYDGEVFEVGQIIDESSSASVLLRQDNGRPLWAGGNGQGGGG
jgi:hypothetical protein